MYIFMFLPLYIFLAFKNSFAGNLYTMLKPTFGIKVVSASKGRLYY